EKLHMTEIGARALGAEVALQLGRPEAALVQARAAVGVARRRGMTQTVAGAFASAVLAGSLVALGRPAEAEAVLAMSIDEVRAVGEPYVLVTHLLALARTHEALGRRAVAARLFDEASDIVEAMPDPGDVRRTGAAARRALRGRAHR